MPFKIIHGDITALPFFVDVIVNSANKNFKRGGGVCGAIFESAGVKEMSEACEKIRIEINYQQRINRDFKPNLVHETPSFNLHANCIFHAVPPKFCKKNVGQSAEKLAEVYDFSLKKFVEKFNPNDSRSIAFPLLGAGINKFPYDLAFKIARENLEKYAENYPNNDFYLVILYK